MIPTAISYHGFTCILILRWMPQMPGKMSLIVSLMSLSKKIHWPKWKRKYWPWLLKIQLLLLKALLAFHGRPVWSATYGWLLVNAADKHVSFPDGHTLPFADITGELFIFAPPFSEAEPPKEPPLTRSEISGQKEIWLEPISPDSDLRRELQGWYQVKDRFVENEFGNRFYLTTYGSKWLAFSSEIKLW